MIIPTIHERCTMEESELAFNQLVTLEQNQLKKKKNNEKTSHFLIFSPLKKSSKTTNEVAGARFPSRSPREGQISRPPLTRERRPEEELRFLKDLGLRRLRCAIVVFVVVYSRLAIMRNFICSQILLIALLFVSMTMGQEKNGQRSPRAPQPQLKYQDPNGKNNSARKSTIKTIFTRDRTCLSLSPPFSRIARRIEFLFDGLNLIGF